MAADQDGFDDADRTYARTIVRAGQSVQDRLREIIEGGGLFSPAICSHRTRVKPYASIFEKVLKKRKDGKSYGVRDVTDVVGFRFITRFRDDIPEVVDGILTLISPTADPNKPHLEKCELKDFIQYRLDPPPEFDPETDQWFDPIKAHLEDSLKDHFGQSIKLIVDRKSGYSSVHIVFFHTVFIDQQQIAVPVECQVRSVFEEAWCEIDHKLFYKDDLEGDEAGEKKRAAVRLHLGVLKQLMDAASNYARVIAELPIRTFRPPDNIIENLDLDASYASALCQKAGLSADLTNNLLELVQEKADLDRATRDTTLRPSTDYIFLGEKILAFLDHLTAATRPKPTQAEHALIYLVRLEATICFLLSNVRQQVDKAIELYRSLSEDFPNRPTVWFRLGQACAHLAAELMEKSKGESQDALELAEEAFDAYSKAATLVDELPSQSKGRDLLISPSQERYITQNVARLQSFICWHISYLRRKGGVPEGVADLSDMVRAYDVASAGLQQSLEGEPRFRLVNGAAYFALEALDLSARLDRPIPNEITTELLAELIDEVSRYCIEHSSTYFNAWHTVLRGNLLLGREQAAIDAAERILDLDESVSEVGLSDYDARMRSVALHEAYRTVRHLLKRRRG